MCSEIFSKIFWIGSKILIVFGALSYLFDIGSDVLFSIQLYISCHVSTGTASICIFLASISFSIFFASNSAWYDFWYLPKLRIGWCCVTLWWWPSNANVDRIDFKYQYKFGYKTRLVENRRQGPFEDGYIQKFFVEFLPSVLFLDCLLHHNGWLQLDSDHLLMCISNSLRHLLDHMDGLISRE